ncbi:PREDICTED: uncharacterized protein LOC102860453 [Elephantulus edwardii]|uniref:uncharacterized protein LOC102860453 n=1 Tax=Elephantulus edwardii TaxID=28737 RepID=UPI0003F0B303|nr:PREDICTED: uncharacterized protein LOC102860453 [Elephantulus edwardii]
MQQALEEFPMAPTFYCSTGYITGKEDTTVHPRKGMWLVALLFAVVLVVVVVGLSVPLSSCVSRVNSKACTDGLAAERECQNTTHLLNHQLSQTLEGFREAEARAVHCTQTVSKLEASLEAEKDQNWQKEAHIEELNGKIKKLNQILQEKSAEVEQLSARDRSMAEPGPGPEPSRAWRLLALCGAAVFLAAVAAGAALLAWNLAASANRGHRCPEPGANGTVSPGNPPENPPGVPTGDPLEVEELRRQVAEAVQRQEALARQLEQAKGARQSLQEALRACEGRQSRLQTQLKTMKMEMDEARAQGTQMGKENGVLTEALMRWEEAAAEATRRQEEAQHRARAAEAEGGACAAREAALRERVNALETEMGPQRRESHPHPRSGSRPRSNPRSRGRPRPSGGCRRQGRRERG